MTTDKVATLRIETASSAQQKGADYMLQVKDNQKSLHEEIAGYFHKVKRDDPARIIANQISDLDGEHGGIVHRQYTMLPIDKWISSIDKWEGAQHTVEVVITQELEGNENTADTSYYLTSLEHHLTEMARVIRG